MSSRVWLQRARAAIERDWQRGIDPFYYGVTTAVFFGMAVVLIVGGDPAIAIAPLLFGVFCAWMVVSEIRKRRKTRGLRD